MGVNKNTPLVEEQTKKGKRTMKKTMKNMMAMIMAIAMTLVTAAMPAFAAAPQSYTITTGGVCSSRRASDQIVGSWASDYGRMVIFKDGRYTAMFGSSMHEETGTWEFDGRSCLMLYREQEHVLLYYSNKTLQGTVNGRRIVFYDDTKAMIPAYNRRAKAKDFNGFWRVRSVSSGSAIAAPAKEMYAYVYGRRVCMSWNDFDGSNEESRSMSFTVKNGVGKFSVRFDGKKYSAKMYQLMDGSLYVVYTYKKTEVAARYVAAVDKSLQ